MQLRQAINDTRGRLAELLGTALNRGALDSELTLGFNLEVQRLT